MKLVSVSDVLSLIHHKIKYIYKEKNKKTVWQVLRQGAHESTCDNEVAWWTFISIKLVLLVTNR